MNKFFIIILLFLITIGASAQENIVKTSPMGFAYGKYNLQYERMLSEYSSVNISASYLKPNLYGFDDVFGDLSGIEVIEGWSLNGAAFSVDYRLYSQNQTGPRGFYLAPYLRYSGLGFVTRVDADVVLIDHEGAATEVDYLESGISVTRYGFGLKMGAQWLVSDLISIDWNFGGAGADLYKLIAYGETNGIVPGMGNVTMQEIDVNYRWRYAFAMNLTFGVAF